MAEPPAACLDAVQKVLMDEVLKWLESGILEVANEAKNAVLMYLNENFGGWRPIVRQGVRLGLDAALAALRAIKDELVAFLHEHSDDIRQAIRNITREPKSVAKAGSSAIVKGVSRLAVSKAAEKTATTLLKEAASTAMRKSAAAAVSTAAEKATTVLLKEAASTAIEKTAVAAMKKTATVAMQKTTKVATQKTLTVALKQGAKVAAQESAKLSSKGVIKFLANPVGIAADVCQAGLEVTGHKEAGKSVGVLGNMASGAMIGGATFGPPGAVVGAMGSLALWVGGELVGHGVEKTIDWSLS